MREVHSVADHKRHDYKAGRYEETFDEVGANIRGFGALDVVEVVKEYFCDTLPGRSPSERYALIFEDADLVSSVRDVIQYAWPRLGPGRLFSAMKRETSK